MVNVRKILLGLLPVVATQPPFMMQQPVHVAEAASTPFDLAATAVACETHRAQRRAAKRAKERAQPEQGGQRISEAWLRTLSPQDCLWRFR